MTENSTANQPTAQSQTNKSNRQATDGIFIINSQTWESLHSVLLNDFSVSENLMLAVLLTYLVLASGTGKDNITTSWSSGAVYRHADVSPKLATKAIAWLVDAGFIKVVKKPEKNKSPVYKLIKGDVNELDIFLPNGLITGVSGEKSALKRLYNEGKSYLLYLFIRLYAFQDKELDVVSPNLISSSITKSEHHVDIEQLYNERNVVKLWGTYDSDFTYSYLPASEFHDFRGDSSEFFYHEQSEKDGFIGFLYILKSLGLINEVYYALRGDAVSKPDEIDFICELDTKEQKHFKEQLLQIGLEKEGSAIDEVIECTRSVVLPSDIKSIHFSIFYQLRYRTKTGASTIKYAKQSQLNRQLNQIFEKLNS